MKVPVKGHNQLSVETKKGLSKHLISQEALERNLEDKLSHCTLIDSGRLVSGLRNKSQT